MLPLKSLQIAIQPGPDVINTQLDQSIEVRFKFLDQLGVRHKLSRQARGPGLQQGGELHLNLGWWDWFSIGDGEDRRSIMTLHNEVGVEVL
jgi:hypothetical protein